MTVLLALFVAPLTLLTVGFAIELFAGIRPLATQPWSGAKAVTAVIVIPAHDEEAMIAGTLAALLGASGKLARILVIADNCTDSTAAEARKTGVEVLERIDPERRGKGFALDHARRHLAPNPPDVVLVVDADCRIDAHSLERLIGACAATRRPCQAVYLLDGGAHASPAVQLSNFAFFIRNLIRQRGLQRLAGRVHLLGTGMALPWSAFDRPALATADIVEDLRMGIELADAGHPPLFVEGAEVWSNSESDRNTLVQRRRWEGGFLAHAIGSGPAMLGSSIAKGDVRRAWAALDLLIPPMALLVMLDLAALLLSAAVAALGVAHAWPFLLLTSALMLAGAALAAAWTAGGSRFVSLGGLARIPFYIAWKLPLYLGLARRGAPKEWLRTRGGGA